jgi:lipopolysaccharide transport system permease protein
MMGLGQSVSAEVVASPAEQAAPMVAARAPVVRIHPRAGWIGVNWRELWQYRDLLGFLAGRDIRVRYKQTLLGVGWAVIQPVVETLIFFVIFHKLGGIERGNPRYLVFAYAAMLVWKLFENALTQASNSLVNNQQLLTKVYFPRLIIPAAAVLSGVVDFLIASALLVPLMVWFKVAPTWAALTIPLWVAFAMLAALAVGLWLSALNVQYRDIRYLVPFLVRVWFFLTPVMYSAGKLPEKWRLVYGLNPLAGAVTGFRWALMPEEVLPVGMMWVSLATTVVLLVGGLFYFRRMEKTFADVV